MVLVGYGFSNRRCVEGFEAFFEVNWVGDAVGCEGQYVRRIPDFQGFPLPVFGVGHIVKVGVVWVCW